MKINWNIVKVLSALLLAALLFGFTNQRNSQRKLSGVDIHFASAGNLFITHETVNKLLIQNKGGVTGITKENLVLNTLESALNANQMIQNAHVYLTVNGQLGATIEQKTPIARVGGEQPYYIDANGLAMPLSTVFSARVPLVTGDVDDTNLAEVHKLAMFIYNDAFLSKNVVGIKKNGKVFRLQLRVDGFTVTVGSAYNLPKKFNNFKAFYQKALKDNTLANYKEVNLIFDNQVVCTKI